MQLFVS